MKKTVPAKVMGLKIGTYIYSRRLRGRLPASIKTAISFDVIQLKSFKIFLERLPSVVIRCFFQCLIIQKWDVFQGSKGCVHGQFFRGQAAGPPFFLTSLAPRFSPPPQYRFRSDRPVMHPSCRSEPISLWF